MFPYFIISGLLANLLYKNKLSGFKIRLSICPMEFVFMQVVFHQKDSDFHSIQIACTAGYSGR